MIELTTDPTIAVPGTMAQKTDFATRNEMTQAARRLIKLHPELGPALNKTPAAYPHLQQAELVMPPTPTPVTEPDGTKMVLVPAGNFTMGSNNGETDERPAHTVYLDDFYMDQYETTNRQYARCIDAGNCTLPGSSRSQEQNNAVVAYHQDPDQADLPVIGVNWDQAKTYCEWREARLPTEAEWEKAARGTNERTYPWGELITCNVANYSSCEKYPASPGSYATGVSPYGIYDLGGNMLEWTSDWHAQDYYGVSPIENPVGPDESESTGGRVLRGGSWGLNDILTRSSNRYVNDPNYQNPFVGVRCAR